ncbi:MAG: hypothetical protein ABI873_11080 [Marmoricola sp.]
MRVAVVVHVRTPASRPSALVPDLCRRLVGHGCTVEILTPDEGSFDLARVRPAHDLYVMNSGTETALSFSGALHAQGARIMNPYPVAAASWDRVVQTRVLLDAGIPVPQSWVTSDPMTLAPQLAQGPLVLKPARGSRGLGTWVSRTGAELQALAGVTPWLVMRYCEPDGLDLKLYRIGDDVFGVECVRTDQSQGTKFCRPFPVTAELRELVRWCGEPFGIGTYGVDVVFSQGRPMVVDMTVFPEFRGVPDAGSRLGDYVFGHGVEVAERAARELVT